MLQVATLLEKARRDPKTAYLYMGIAAGCFFVYLVLLMTGMEFWDHWMTWSAVAQSMAFALLAMKVKASDVGGLSPTMMAAYCISYVARLSTTLTLQGYLPEDVTSDVYIYQLSELGGLVIVGHSLYRLMVLRQKSAAMCREIETEEAWVLPAMIFGCALLGLLTRSDGHDHFLGDWIWMFAQWMDSIAIAPQLWLVSKKKEVERRTSHFIVLMIIARLAISWFWSTIIYNHDLYWEFTAGIVLSNLIHLAMCGDYLYYFVATISAPSMMLPGSDMQAFC